MSNLDLGIVGNGTIAALIDAKGCYQWFCLPRFDGEPVFDALLGGEAQFSITLEDCIESAQTYDRNSAVLRTRLTASDGSAVEIIDFAPRFEQRGRVFRPAALVRQIKLLSGSPRICVSLTPRTGWGERAIRPLRGVNHVRFLDGDTAFRVTTDAPVSFVLAGTPFNLDGDISFILNADESLSDSAGAIARDWAERTLGYWRHWARSLAIPFEWQSAVIRAAITLKLCVYEETGGIVAALTTSVSEHEGSQRNWDYRFCWIRDAYFTVTALNRLSAMGTLEHYLRWVRNVISQAKGGHIQPVYGIGLESDLTEGIAAHLPGYRGSGPVRIGNQAAEHIQHDVYGQVILAATQAFFDTRLFANPGIEEFHQLEPVGERAFAVHDTPDAGIWEFRSIAQVHTSSAIMCWAACDRLSRIAAHLGLDDRAAYWAQRAGVIHETVMHRGWNAEIGAFTAAYEGVDLDASVLLMTEIGFIDPADPRYVSTVDQIGKTLKHGNHIYRYAVEDDFGRPKTAFMACTFWYIDALHRVGRKDEARQMFEAVLADRNPLGILSEDIVPETRELWGNLPQTYCMVGIINSASLLSKAWASVL